MSESASATGDDATPPGDEAGDGTGSDDGGVLEADLLPWGRKRTEGAVPIRIYVVTGRHGILRIPESFCRECHMFARRADQAAERVAADVDVSVHSWWTNFPRALRYGGYHPPVMVVGNSMLCQGHDVPTVEEVVAAIEDEVGE